MTRKEFYTKAVLMFAQQFADQEDYHTSNLNALDAAEDLMAGIDFSWRDMNNGECFFDDDSK